MTTTPVDSLAAALDATGSLVTEVPDDSWDRPTPCPGWTVRDLVDHVVAGNLLVAARLDGEPEAPPADDDPAAAYRQSADALLRAFGRPGALERVVTVPFGSVPGVVALHLRLVEALVHGWDLASATGQELRVPDEIVEQALGFSRSRLGSVPEGRRPFGPPLPVADDAPVLDRLAALLGRVAGHAAAAEDRRQPRPTRGRP